jgi:hypothetical protein
VKPERATEFIMGGIECAETARGRKKRKPDVPPVRARAEEARSSIAFRE